MTASATLPHLGDDHPAALAFHLLHNAAQILRGDDLVADDYARADELLGQGTHQVAQLYQLLIRTERAFEELRVENARLTRCNERLEATDTRIRRQLAAARQAADALVRSLQAMPLTPESIVRPMSVSTEPAPLALRSEHA